MKYLMKSRGRYYYNGRVPENAREFAPRHLIRVALRTENKEQAIRKAAVYSEQIEAYWQSLNDSRQRHDGVRFKRVISAAQKMGFAYQPMSVLTTVPIVELIERVLALKAVLRNKSKRSSEDTLNLFLR